MDGGNECEKLPAKFSSTFIAHFAMRAISTFYVDTIDSMAMMHSVKRHIGAWKECHNSEERTNFVPLPTLLNVNRASRIHPGSS